MVLVDTSVWIDHFRSANYRLISLLEAAQVVVHPFVLGELACGNLSNRTNILALLKALPQATTIENDKLLYFIESQSLSGKGLGLIDIHLLASAKVEKIGLWTNDKSLKKEAIKLKISI